MPQQLVKFFIVANQETADAQQDLDKIFSQLGTISGIKLRRNQQGVNIAYQQTPLEADLLLPKAKEKTSLLAFPTHLILTCHQADNVTISLLRNLAIGIGYRVFNPTLGCFLPTNPNLTDLTTIKLKRKLKSLFSILGFRPLFNLRGTYTFFAQNSRDSSIHITNQHLIKHLVDFGLQRFDLNKFSLKVAPSLSYLIASLDEDLLPLSFYKYSQPPTSIINLSEVNLNNQETKVIIKPLIFQFNPTKQAFYALASEGSEFTYPPQDKPRVLFQAFLKDYLTQIGIAENFLAAKVAKNIYFKKDTQKNLTPVLNVSLFIDQLKSQKQLRAKLRQQGFYLTQMGNASKTRLTNHKYNPKIAN